MSAATVMCVDRLSFANSSVGILRERLDGQDQDNVESINQPEAYLLRPLSGNSTPLLISCICSS